MDAPFSMRAVRSTTDTSGVGTRKAIPVSLPFNSGITFPTALAAPVDEGMMFAEAQRPPRQSLPPRLGPSTVNCVAVMAWTVVINPSTKPNFSWTTFASGASQFLAHVISTSRPPSDRARILLMEDLDLLAVDNQKLFAIRGFMADCACELLVYAVILELVHHVIQGHEGVVHGHNLHIRIC